MLEDENAKLMRATGQPGSPQLPQAIRDALERQIRTLTEDKGSLQRQLDSRPPAGAGAGGALGAGAGGALGAGEREQFQKRINDLLDENARVQRSSGGGIGQTGAGAGAVTLEEKQRLESRMR